MPLIKLGQLPHGAVWGAPPLFAAIDCLIWRMLRLRHRVGRIASGGCFALLFLLFGWMLYHLLLGDLRQLWRRCTCLLVQMLGRV